MGRIARGVSYVFIAQVVRMAAKGGLILILTRYLLTPARYGKLFLAITILGLALMLANLGLGKAGARYVTEYSETEPELVPVVVRQTLVFKGIAIAVVAAGLYAFHRQIAALAGEPSIAALLVVGIGYVAVRSLSGGVTMLFQGFNRMDLTAGMGIVANVLLIVAVPGLLALNFGLEGAIAGYAFSYGVAAVIGLVVLYRGFYSPVDVERARRRNVSKRVLGYSVPLTFTMGANVLNSRVDTILISVFRGPTAVAFYTLGKQIVDFLIAPAHSLGFGISPTVGEQKAADDLEGAAQLYERSFVYTVALYGPAAAGVVFVADPTIRLLFGSDFAGAVVVLQIFSLFVVVRALDAITSDALDYLGRARSRAIAKGGLAAGNFVLNLLLIPPFGIVGATAATVLAQTVYVGVELLLIADELPLDVARLLRSTLLVGGITAGMSAVVYPLAGGISSIPALVGVVCVGGLVWLVLTVLTGVVDLRRAATALV